MGWLAAQLRGRGDVFCDESTGDSNERRSLMSMNVQRLTELQARHQQTHSGVRQADETARKRAGGKIGKEDERTEF